MGKTEATNPNLSLLILDKARDHPYPISDFPAPHKSTRLEATAVGWCLVLVPSTRIKLEIYYTSIKQQERNCCCQLKSLKIIIKVRTNNALHAYKPLLPAVKTSQPHGYIVNI